MIVTDPVCTQYALARSPVTMLTDPSDPACLVSVLWNDHSWRRCESCVGVAVRRCGWWQNARSLLMVAAVGCAFDGRRDDVVVWRKRCEDA